MAWTVRDYQFSVRTPQGSEQQAKVPFPMEGDDPPVEKKAPAAGKKKAAKKKK